MPTESYLPKLEIPEIDIWGFLFERKDKPYPDDKGLFGPLGLCAGLQILRLSLCKC